MIVAEVQTTTAYVNDLSLDGDEELAVGEKTAITDGVWTHMAEVTHRDEENGIWYFKVLYNLGRYTPPEES